MSERNSKLTKAQLLKKLERCAMSDDTESAHADADALLLEYIDDADIAAAYSRVDKWYA